MMCDFKFISHVTNTCDIIYESSLAFSQHLSCFILHPSKCIYSVVSLFDMLPTQKIVRKYTSNNQNLAHFDGWGINLEVHDQAV